MTIKRAGSSLIFIACLVAVYMVCKTYYSLPSNDEVIPVLRPSLVVPLSPILLGEGYVGEIVEGKIALQNQGARSIRIDRVVPSCGCSTVNVREGFTVEPGETEFLTISTRLPPTYDSQGKKYNLRIFTNDPANNIIDIIVFVKSKPSWVITEPNELDFHQVCSRKEYSRLVFINNALNEEVSYSIEKGFIHVSKAQVQQGGDQRLAFKVTIKPNMPLGVFSDNLILSNASGQKAVVNVRGVVYDGVQMEPKQLDLERGVRCKSVFVIRYLEDEPNQVNITVPAFLTYELKKLSTGNSLFALVVTYAGDEPDLPDTEICVASGAPNSLLRIPILWKGALK